MGWYLRKSLRFGPLRINLSKSGLGGSVGVKGLRVGLGPRGRYLHAGRGGLYYRTRLDERRGSPDTSEAVTAAPDPEPAPVDEAASTGTGPAADPMKNQLGRRLLGAIAARLLRGR